MTTDVDELVRALVDALREEWRGDERLDSLEASWRETLSAALEVRASAEREACLHEIEVTRTAMAASEPKRTVAYIRRHGWAPSILVSDIATRIRARARQ